MSRLFLLLLCLVPLYASAKIDDRIVGLGNLTEHVGLVQTDETGSKRKLSFAPQLLLGLEWKFTEKFSFLPKVGLGLPESDAQTHIQRWHYQFLFDLGFHWGDFLLSLGPGLSFTRLTSDGGELVLANGLGETSFPLPDFTSTSRNLILSLGLEYFLTPSWSAGAEIYTFNLTDKEKRAYSYLLKINYHFGAWEWKN